MNFSEFKKKLGAEPRSQDPLFLSARDSDPAFRAAAKEAEEFEDKLEAALAVEAPAELLDRIRAIPRLDAASKDSSGRHSIGKSQGWRPSWKPLAAAAGVVLAVGLAVWGWWESTFYWESVDAYVVDHWGVDGEEFVSLADGQPVDQAKAIELFASHGMEVSPTLAGQIDILGICRTPGSFGLHLVLHTERGPVTVIFMPEVETVDGHTIAFQGLLAQTLQLEKGSAVIIGPDEASIAPVYAMARAAIRPIAQTG